MSKIDNDKAVPKAEKPAEERPNTEREQPSEKIIEKVFSEIDFGRYSISKSAFVKAAKVENQLPSVMAKLENLTNKGLLNFANGFYGLTKEGRNYFTEKKSEKIVIHLAQKEKTDQDS